MSYERTRVNAALFGFYASCTGVGLGATVAASALIVFGESPSSTPVATAAIVLAVVCSVLAWWTLRRARDES